MTMSADPCMAAGDAAGMQDVGERQAPAAAAAVGGLEALADRYRAVCGFAQRLIRGEIIGLVDERGREWIASASFLFLISRDAREGVVVVRGDAFDVAHRLSAVPID
jgi:hypothetical protein